jgi:mRNA interferase HigB
MQIRIIKKSNVFEHIGTNKFMSKAFQDFFDKLEYLDWHNPQDITQSFKSADLINCPKKHKNRVVFNIGRNRYRLICGYYFGLYQTILFIKFVGTHKEYDAIDVCIVDQFKSTT